jgi:Spy/CpxP family protein refolding chaperone
MPHDRSFAPPRILLCGLAAASLALASPTLAQTASAAPSADHEIDPIAQRVFPPELVMGHANQIGLSDAQRERILTEVRRLQLDVQTIASRNVQARDRMVAALSTEPVEEANVLAALDRVLAAERDIKRLHIATLVRIGSVLTPTQRARLNTLR